MIIKIIALILVILAAVFLGFTLAAEKFIEEQKNEK